MFNILEIILIVYLMLCVYASVYDYLLYGGNKVINNSGEWRVMAMFIAYVIINIFIYYPLAVLIKRRIVARVTMVQKGNEKEPVEDPWND